MQHPYVSESHEGKPVFEWAVAICVAVATVLAGFGHTMAATALVSVAAIGCAAIRQIMKNRSPWKIRSVGFDAFCGYAFGILLPILYFSIRFGLH